jgi:hypothetical protein
MPKENSSTLKNWAGIDSHPTDEYVHWSKTNPIVTMQDLRRCWDALEQAGLLHHVKFLIDAAVEAAKQDAEDSKEWD